MILMAVIKMINEDHIRRYGVYGIFNRLNEDPVIMLFGIVVAAPKDLFDA